MKKTVIFLTALFVFSGLASAQSASTNLDILVMDTEPVPLQAGQYADVWVRVTNNGSATAQNASFELVEEFPFEAQGRSTWNPGVLEPGESYQFRAQLRVSENAVHGENELKIRKTSGNNDNWITESVALEVRTDDRSLMVSDLYFPEKVEPGSSAEMTLTLENFANSNFRNIDVEILTEELPVAPRETSRQRISSVEPDEPENVSFTIDVDDDAENDLHNLPIEISYQNQAGDELSMSETTGLNIGGYPNIDIAVDDSDIRTEGQGTVTLRILNRGEGQARFAEVQLEETGQYEILSENSIYLGSMIADDYQTAEFDLYVENASETLELPVTVNYRDGEGDQTYETTVERTLYSGSELRQYGLEQNGGTWLIPVVVLAVLAGGAYYWRKRRNRE